MTTINRFLFLALIVGFVSCSSPTKEVCIDNPTDSDITIHFDVDEPIQIDAKGKKCIPLKFGKRTLHFNDTQTSLLLEGERDYIINPTKSTYYIQNIPYVISGKGQENYNNDYGSPTSEIGAIIINGDYEEIKDKILIAKNWTFGLDEEASASARIQNPKNGYYIVRKIHRGTDIQDALSESMIKQLEESLTKYINKK